MSTGKYYAEEIIEEVINRNDIVDVISSYVQIKRKGKDYFGLCPFHNEKTPSFSVVPSKQIFYCFGCGKGGNVINFIKNIENLDYIDSLKFLADKVSIVLPESNNPGDVNKQKKVKNLLEMNILAAKYFYNNLKGDNSLEARKYFSERGLLPETIKKFGLGHADDNWDTLIKHLKSKGYTEKQMVDGGLASINKYGKYYDKFRNRIIFPIIDIRNRVIAFGGRILKGEGPKYLNSPETIVYNKGTHLYGMNIAKGTKKDFVIIVEGYMDCIALHQVGIDNTVASLGTALTMAQGKLIKKIFSEVIIAYDSDSAGQKATIRGLDLLTKIGCSVKVLLMEEYKDPDEYIKNKGSNQFEKLIQNSIPLVEYKAMLLKTIYNIKTTDGKIKFLNGVAKAITQVLNAVEREMYVKKISSTYNISEQSLFLEIRKNLGDITQEELEKRKSLDLKLIKIGKPIDKEFLSVISLLCVNNDFFHIVNKYALYDYIEQEKFKKLFKDIAKRVQEKRLFDEIYILSLLEEEDVPTFSGVAAAIETSNDYNKALIEKTVNYISEIIKNRITKLTIEVEREENIDKTIILKEALLNNMKLLRNIKKH